MNRNAIGFLEVQGYSVALAAMDSACKAANIKIEGIDCNNPSMGEKAPIPVVVQVKFTGGVSDVKIALEVARTTAERYINQEDIITHCIPSGSEEIIKLLSLGKVKQK